MTQSNNYIPIIEEGNGVTTVFSSNDWGVLASSHLKVYLKHVDTGVETLQTAYSLVFTANSFVVTFDTAPSDQYSVLIYRDVPITQEAAYKTALGFQGQATENSFDKITQIAQNLEDRISRAVTFPVGNPIYDLNYPTPAALKVLGWNEAETGLINIDITDFIDSDVFISETFNVQAYGALGNGSANDTAAIQAAIDAANDGDIVFFPYGTYLHTALTINKSITLRGVSAKGSILRYTGSSTGITRGNELTNTITNGLICEGIDFQADNETADVKLIDIYGGNSQCQFTRCRFGLDEERTTTLTLTGTVGTFVVGETITGGTSAATATIITVVSSTSLIITEDNGRFYNSETITGGTSAATATVSSAARKGQSVGVRFIGSSAPALDDVFRPSVYGLFTLCEFVNLKIGVKAQYAGYKKMNETVFLDCSFQYTDYAFFDGQQTSGVKFFGGGIELWKKTGIYSDGEYLTIYGTRFERGGVATEATYAPSFTEASVNTTNNTITINSHSFKNGDEVVLESPRDGTNRNLVIWPAGLVPGEIYYIVEAAANTVKLSATLFGSAIDITSTGDPHTYYLRKLSNIPFQYGYNSDRMAEYGILTNVSGGPERYRKDGTNNAHYGLRELNLDGQTITENLVVKSPKLNNSVMETVQALASQSADLLRFKNAAGFTTAQVAFNGILTHSRIAQTASTGTVTVDANNCDYGIVTATGNITVTIANGANNQEITLRLVCTGGAHTITLGSASQLLAGGAYTHSGNNKTDMIKFIKDAVSGNWLETSRAMDIA